MLPGPACDEAVQKRKLSPVSILGCRPEAKIGKALKGLMAAAFGITQIGMG